MSLLPDRIHVLNCLCYRDKPAAMGYVEGGADPGCVMLQTTACQVFADIHSAWLALADGNIDEADRLLIKWIKVYRTESVYDTIDEGKRTR